jgi:alkylation response protein AidB-like acyl-CoA dehydrogenase
LSDELNSFLDSVVRPNARAIDENNQMSPDIVDGLRNLGLFGLVVPKRWDGTSVPVEQLLVVVRKLAHASLAVSGLIGGHTVVSWLLAEFGSEEQQQRYLPRMSSGSLRAALALSEHGAGSDLQAVRTSISMVDGTRIAITGEKTWVTNGLHSDLFLVLARDATSAEGRLRLVIVEKADGVEVGPRLNPLGYRGTGLAQLRIPETTIDTSRVLGSPNENGMAQLAKGLELARLQVAARALGVAEAALDEALEYATQRVTFGRDLWEHQAVGHRLADMATSFNAALALVSAAASAMDRGELAEGIASMAKLFATESAQEITLDAMRILASRGYEAGKFESERLYRDAPSMILGEGTSEIQKNLIVRALVRRRVGGGSAAAGIDA